MLMGDIISIDEIMRHGVSLMQSIYIYKLFFMILNSPETSEVRSRCTFFMFMPTCSRNDPPCFLVFCKGYRPVRQAQLPECNRLTFVIFKG